MLQKSAAMLLVVVGCAVAPRADALSCDDRVQTGEAFDLVIESVEVDGAAADDLGAYAGFVPALFNEVNQYRTTGVSEAVVFHVYRHESSQAPYEWQSYTWREVYEVE